IADARRKAEIYAKAAGVTLGAPISISEGGIPQPQQVFRFGAAKMPTPIAQGEETLSITVGVTWAIKPQ
nr:SIMPL domain-containing protein [Bradyrhizobium sp.]